MERMKEKKIVRMKTFKRMKNRRMSMKKIQRIRIKKNEENVEKLEAEQRKE